MIRQPLFTFCGLALMCAACTRPAPDAAPTEPVVVANPDASEIDPPAFMGDLPIEEERTILLAAGCADDDTLTASACSLCPAPPGETSRVSQVSIIPSQFGDTRGAVVFAEGCGEDGGTARSSLVALEPDASGTWAIMGVSDLIGGITCQESPGARGVSSTICLSESRRYGTRSSYYELFDWEAVHAGEQKEPSRTTLLELAERDSCELNVGIEHIVVGPTYPDTDQDGTPEIMLQVTTTTGPFTGTLDTCPEDNFSGPLKPERAAKTWTTTYIYEQLQDGVKEREGQGTYLSLGQEFEDLMEP